MKKRLIRIEGALAFVPLTQGKTAVIDAADVCLVEGFNWRHKAGYAVTTARSSDGKRCIVRMHRVIAQTPSDFETDHINGDKLDNRRENLRRATRSENMRNTGIQINNTSGYKGVTWSKARSKWRAKIGLHGKRIHLGYHESQDAANQSYIDAATRLHGEFQKNCSSTRPNEGALRSGAPL